MFDAVVRSHRSTQGFLDVVDAWSHGDPAADWRGALTSLAPLLPGHFAAEVVPGGFFDTITRCLGERPTVALRREHRQMLTWLDAMNALDGPRLERGVRAFADTLRTHEGAESELALRCERILGG
jgi:hypothetical protein